MIRSFVVSQPDHVNLSHLPPSSPDEIRAMVAAAGLKLPPALMEELCGAFPAFEAMVRRLPRTRNRFDQPAHTIDVCRVVIDKAGERTKG
jgi:hypothetical protein